MIYITELNTCPVGCGVGLVFLKSVESGKIFVHCLACGLAWGRIPVSDGFQALDPPDIFAPKGIALPVRSEIEASGFGSFVASEHSDEDYANNLWRLRAKTFLEAEQYKEAIGVLTRVIDTWDSPPKLAYQLRASAYRQVGKPERAAEDERKAQETKGRECV